MSELKQDIQTPETGGEKHDSRVRLVIPFFAVLALLTAASFLLPLRPTVSYAEKRELAAFPEFSLETLADGSYFDDISAWFSDTFPGREIWLEVSGYTTSLHGYSDISIEGDLMISDEVPVETSAPPGTSQPTESGATEETEGETETETTVPEETVLENTEWGGVDAGNAAEIDLGAVIQIGDTAFNQQGFSAFESDRYIETLSTLAGILAEKNVRVISCPAPTSVGVMVEAEYLEMLNCARQDEMLAYLHDNMTNGVITVDTFSNIVKHNSEYLYFRTDHHWTALGAYYAYEALCQALGEEAVPLGEFEELDQGEFRGTLYGKVRWPQKLTLDNVYVYVPQGDISVKAYYNNNTSFVERDLIWDMAGRNIYETYLTFLGGDCALMEITNESIPDAPSCVVIKDSYGNCFVPYLTQHYYKVFAIDYRKYYEMNLQTFVDYFGIEDVIFAPNMTAVQSNTGENLFYDLSFKYTGKRWQ